MGCVEQTFSAMVGMEGPIATEASEYRRNDRCGKLIEQSYKPDQAVKKFGMVVEGINAIPAAMRLGKKYRVEILLVTAVMRLSLKIQILDRKLAINGKRVYQ